MSAIAAPPAPSHRHADRILAAGALVCVGLQFPGELAWSAAAVALWVVAVALCDRSLLARLWMPRFLSLTVLVGLASSLLLGERDFAVFGVPLSSLGLRAGALMVVRGVLIVGLTAWASRALTREDAKWLRRLLRHEQLATAIATALGLIPALTERLHAALDGADRRSRLHPRRLREALVSVVFHAACVAEEAAARHGAGRRLLRPLRVAVIGPQGSGKTTTLEILAARLRATGVEAGGVTQPVHYIAGQRAYDLREVGGEARCALARAHTRGSGFEFAASAWVWAAQRIRQARASCDVLVVDELGRLEAGGEGHLRAIAAPVSHERCRLWLLGVRADAAEELAKRLGPFDLVLSPSDDRDTIDGYVEAIKTLPRQECGA